MIKVLQKFVYTDGVLFKVGADNSKETRLWSEPTLGRHIQAGKVSNASVVHRTDSRAFVRLASGVGTVECAKKIPKMEDPFSEEEAGLARRWYALTSKSKSASSSVSESVADKVVGKVDVGSLFDDDVEEESEPPVVEEETPEMEEEEEEEEEEDEDEEEEEEEEIELPDPPRNDRLFVELWELEGGEETEEYVGGMVFLFRKDENFDVDCVCSVRELLEHNRVDIYFWGNEDDYDEDPDPDSATFCIESVPVEDINTKNLLDMKVPGWDCTFDAFSDDAFDPPTEVDADELGQELKDLVGRYRIYCDMGGYRFYFWPKRPGVVNMLLDVNYLHNDEDYDYEDDNTYVEQDFPLDTLLDSGLGAEDLLDLEDSGSYSLREQYESMLPSLLSNQLDNGEEVRVYFDDGCGDVTYHFYLNKKKTIPLPEGKYKIYCDFDECSDAYGLPGHVALAGWEHVPYNMTEFHDVCEELGLDRIKDEFLYGKAADYVELTEEEVQILEENDYGNWVEGARIRIASVFDECRTLYSGSYLFEIGGNGLVEKLIDEDYWDEENREPDRLEIRGRNGFLDVEFRVERDY